MVIGTCGHEVSDTGKHGLGYSIAVREQDREGRWGVAYIVVCAKCLAWWRKKKLIVEEF